MNKKVILGTTLGIVTLGLSAQVLAAEGDYQTIEKETEAKISTRGNLGKIDPTDPETPLPEGSKEWIKVTLPTAVVFYTPEKDGVVQETITSPTNYKITNKSGRPVKIDVASYKITSSSDALQTLNLENAAGAAFQKVVLVEAGNAKNEINQELVKLANHLGELNGPTKPSTTNFKFTGSIDKNKLPTGENAKAEYIDSELALKFTALKLDGTEAN